MFPYLLLTEDCCWLLICDNQLASFAVTTQLIDDLMTKGIKRIVSKRRPTYKELQLLRKIICCMVSLHPCDDFFFATWRWIQSASPVQIGVKVQIYSPHHVKRSRPTWFRGIPRELPVANAHGPVWWSIAQRIIQSVCPVQVTAFMMSGEWYENQMMQASGWNL